MIFQIVENRTTCKLKFQLKIWLSSKESIAFKTWSEDDDFFTFWLKAKWIHSLAYGIKVKDSHDLNFSLNMSGKRRWLFGSEEILSHRAYRWLRSIQNYNFNSVEDFISVWMMNSEWANLISRAPNSLLLNPSTKNVSTNVSL